MAEGSDQPNLESSNSVDNTITFVVIELVVIGLCIMLAAYCAMNVKLEEANIKDKTIKIATAGLKKWNAFFDWLSGTNDSNRLAKAEARQRTFIGRIRTMGSFLDWVNPFNRIENALKGHSIINKKENNLDSLLTNIQPKTIQFNESKSNTTIQIIFIDGTKKTLKINLTTTILDIYAHFRAVSGYKGKFYLIAGFPPKTLSNPNGTVESEKLSSTRITQKQIKSKSNFWSRFKFKKS